MGRQNLWSSVCCDNSLRMWLFHVNLWSAYNKNIQINSKLNIQIKPLIIKQKNIENYFKVNMQIDLPKTKTLMVSEICKLTDQTSL